MVIYIFTNALHSPCAPLCPQILHHLSFTPAVFVVTSFIQPWPSFASAIPPSAASACFWAFWLCLETADHHASVIKKCSIWRMGGHCSSLLKLLRQIPDMQKPKQWPAVGRSRCCIFVHSPLFLPVWGGYILFSKFVQSLLSLNRFKLRFSSNNHLKGIIG